MISNLPREEIPEAVFEERELGDSEAAPLFEKALASFRDGSFPKAVEQLRGITARLPNDPIAPYARFLTADCYARMAGNDRELLREAVSIYLDGVRTYPLSDEAPRGLYQAGRGLFMQGFYYEAAAQMDRIAVYYPESRYAEKGMLAKGVIYFYQKKYPLAESLFKRVLKGNISTGADKTLVGLWLANVCHMEGRHAEAGDLYKTVERNGHEYLEKSGLSILLMGETFMALGESGRGRGLFEMYLKLYPDSMAVPFVMLRTADAMSDEGRKADALRLYSRAASLYPSSDAAIMGKARAAERGIEEGDGASAAAVLQDALALKGSVAREAATLIAGALRRAGMSFEAAKAYRAILDRFGEGMEYALKGKLTESLADAVEKAYSRKDYLSVLRLYYEESGLLKKVGETRFLKMIGDSYLEAGFPSEAAAVYGKLLPSKEFMAMSAAFREETLFRAVEAYIRAGEKENAEKTVAVLLKEFPKTRFKEKAERALIGREAEGDALNAYLGIARKHLNEGKFSEAAGYYRKVIDMKIAASLDAAYIGLGDSYFGMGRYREAIDAYEVGRAGGGENGHWALYRMGESYYNLGEMEKAKQAFQAARGNKGIYGKMAAEGLKGIEMKTRIE
jgi:TolA-binding protein